MMVETWIAIFALVILLTGAFVVHMDAKYQRERRHQRLAQRFGNQDV